MIKISHLPLDNLTKFVYIYYYKKNFMKKIIDLIKKLLGGGTMAEKAVQLQQLETEVVKEVEVVKEKVAEVKAKVKKVKEATQKAPKKTTTK